MAGKIHRIGVISDTHGLIRERVREVLETCEVILHGGDMHHLEVLDELEKIAPVYAVRGNNDGEWAEHLPETLSFELYGLKIIMIHNKRCLPQDLKDRSLILCGHSHKYDERREGDRLWLNPGSCGPRRFGLAATMAVIEVEEGEENFRVRKIEIPHEMK